MNERKKKNILIPPIPEGRKIRHDQCHFLKRFSSFIDGRNNRVMKQAIDV